MALNASTIQIRPSGGQAAAVADLTAARGSKDARPSAGAGSDVSDLYLEHLRAINATFADQLKVVDQKAAYVFTFLVAMMIWSQQVRSHFSRVLKPALTLDWGLSFLLAGSLTCAALASILVVVPRFVQSDGPLFWGAWPEAGARLEAERSAFDERRMADTYRRNAESLAELCATKYRLVRCSYRSLLLGVGAYVVSIATV